MLPKFIVYCLSFIVLILSTTLPVYAQTATQSSVVSRQSSENQVLPTTNYQLPTYVSPTSPLYTDLLVNNLFHSFSCLAVGQSVIGQPCLTYQMTKNAQGLLQGVPVLSQVNTSGGALGATTSVIGALYQNPPVRTADYLASVGKGLGIVKEANAQVIGSGAAVLNPILSLWQTSRNISYVIMIIIFVIIGLMVMFRNKLNPQTVITAQAALPGLVIGLIMITFSYFLVGLIADTAFIGTNVVGYYFVSARGQLNSTDAEWKQQLNLTNKISGDSVISIGSSLLKGIKKQDIVNGVGTLFTVLGEPDPTDTSNPATLIRSFAAIVAYQVGSQIGPAIGASAAALGCGAATIWTGPGALVAIPTCAGIGQAVGSLGGGLFLAQQTWSNPAGYIGFALWIIAIAIIVYSMIKLLLKLINVFLTIIFLTITAPFQLLVASLPGRQGIATGWILSLLGNILVFPAVIAVFYFVAYILGQTYGPLKISAVNPEQNTSYISPAYAAGTSTSTTMVGTATFPLLGGLDLGFIKILLAFGALIATPAIPDIVIRSISKASQAGQLIGQEISGSTRAGRGYIGQAQGGIGGVSRDVGNLGGIAPGQTLQAIPDGKGGFTYEWVKTPGRYGELGKRFGFWNTPKQTP